MNRKSGAKRKVNLKSAAKPIVINRPTRPPRTAISGKAAQNLSEVNNFSNFVIPLTAVWYFMKN